MTPRQFLNAAAICAAAVALIVGAAACASPGSTEMDVYTDRSEASLPPTPQVATPQGVAPAPEPVAKATDTPTEAADATGLVWMEVDLSHALGVDENSTIRLESVGDGRVLAFSFIDRGIDTISVTENSTEWTLIPVPAGFLPWNADIAGDRWLIEGWDSTLEAPFTQILFSDDEGASWTEVVVDLDSIDGTAWTADAIVAGELIVVAALSDGGLPDADEALEGDMNYEPTRASVHILVSDGGPAELVTEFPGWFAGGYGASDGFHLIVSGDEGDYLLSSPDGREWTTTTIDVEITDSAMNKIWTADDGYTEYRIERFEGVYGSGQLLTTPDGVGRVVDLEVGPAGVAAVGGAEVPTPEGDTESTALGEYDPNEFSVGWSPEGANWQWQTLQEAFGLPERREGDDLFNEVQLAVGRDFVLAQVQIFGLTAPEISTSPPRWFIARVD